MDYSKEQLARIWLQSAPMNGWNKLSALKKRMGGASAVWDQFTPALYEALGPQLFSELADRRMHRCSDVLSLLEQCGARAVFYGDTDYPALLATIENPPDVIFLRGQLPAPGTPSVAIVGSRSSTRYGEAQAGRIARELGEAGVCVVSGLARGVDAAAHQGALKGGGPTVAVLGCGLSVCYPPENKALFQQIIASGGGIISELHPAAAPLPYHFPVRNRIISGLSHALLLIEAREKSGTHSTVHYALDQGREVFALPGNVDAPGSELPLKLLREGAGLCASGEDILSAMGWHSAAPMQQSLFGKESETAETDPILRALSLEEKTLEELIAETGLSASELGVQLTLLELNGQIERRAGRAYAKRR